MIAAVVRRPALSWRALAPAAVPVLVAVLVIVPWTIRNAHVWGEFVPITTQTGGTLAGSYNDTSRHADRFPGRWGSLRTDPTLAPIVRSRLPEPEVDRRLRHEAFAYIERHPLYVLEVGFRNTVRIFHLDGFDWGRHAMRHLGFAQRFADIGTVSFWIVALLALLGVANRSVRRTPLFVWLTPLLLLASVVFISGGEPRFERRSTRSSSCSPRSPSRTHGGLRSGATPRPLQLAPMPAARRRSSRAWLTGSATRCCPVASI